MLRCQGQAVALLGAEERERRLAEYGGVLAALARDDSPLRRVAWIERTLPADGDAMADYLMDNKREDASLDDPPDELVSYFQLLRRSPDVAEDHELLFCVQIDARRASCAPRDQAHWAAVTWARSPCSPARWGRSPTCSTPPASASPACSLAAVSRPAIRNAV